MWTLLLPALCFNYPCVQVPAYAASASCVFDLTPVTSQDKLASLSTDDLHRSGYCALLA
jgi:hypothetical protein